MIPAWLRPKNTKSPTFTDHLGFVIGEFPLATIKLNSPHLAPAAVFFLFFHRDDVLNNFSKIRINVINAIFTLLKLLLEVVMQLSNFKYS